jgi:hypothetical protein
MAVMTTQDRAEAWAELLLALVLRYRYQKGV